MSKQSIPLDHASIENADVHAVDSPAEFHPRRNSGNGWFAIALALTLIGSACLGLGIAVQYHAPVPAHNLDVVSEASLARKAVPKTHVSTSKQVAPTSLKRSTPVLLSIPTIGVHTRLTGLGLNSNGSVQVPTDFQEPGWYKLGPSPGQLGSAVILGHVDSISGPAVFFDLGSLRPGDTVTVTLADGVAAHFVVDGIATYPKTGFPTCQVYGRVGGSTLQLVTCTGSFDSTTHHYLSNLVVYSKLTSTTVH